ncbi:MAG: hypothetical protein R3F11_12785 [Verrucomicrobiales bacterium]
MKYEAVKADGEVFDSYVSGGRREVARIFNPWAAVAMRQRPIFGRKMGVGKFLSRVEKEWRRSKAARA